MAAANHGEGIGGRKISSAGKLGDGFLAGVDEVGIHFGFERIGPDAKHAVFGLQNDVHAFENVIGHERGHADAKIDVIAVAQFKGDAAGDAFAFLIVGQHEQSKVKSLKFTVKPKDKNTGLKTGRYNFRTVRRSMRFS